MGPGFSSLFYRREKRVMEMVENYIEKVTDAVKHLEELSEAVKSGRFERLAKIYSSVDLLESEADDMRRRISEELCRGVFFGRLREDLLDLLDEIDNIADYAKDAIKQLVETTPSWDLLHFTFSLPEMDRYIRSCVMASEKLLQSFRVFRSDVEKARPLLREIERLEEEADDLRMSILKTVLSEGDNYRVIDLILVKEMIGMMDNICDSAEDASDILFQIIAGGYG